MIFPEGSDLKLSASTKKTTYKPGDKASLQIQVASTDGKLVEAALGIAVVDKAVLERARTDSNIRTKDWFSCAFCVEFRDTEIGGIRLKDLCALKPSDDITPELDLVAEAIALGHSGYIGSENGEGAYTPEFNLMTTHMKQLQAALDEHYSISQEVPLDASDLNRMIGQQWNQMRDPWGTPYSVTFHYGSWHSFTMKSAGPDKQSGTGDDFEKFVLWPYFEPTRQSIEKILRKHPNYPADNSEFVRILGENKLLFSSLHDPWGISYLAKFRTSQERLIISIISAGPDHKFETPDDFSVADIRGPYKEATLIGSALLTSAVIPKSIEEFLEILKNAGIDASQYRDAWGQPYRITSKTESRYGNKKVKPLQKWMLYR